MSSGFFTNSKNDHVQKLKFLQDNVTTGQLIVNKLSNKNIVQNNTIAIYCILYNAQQKLYNTKERRTKLKVLLLFSF